MKKRTISLFVVGVVAVGAALFAVVKNDLLPMPGDPIQQTTATAQMGTAVTGRARVSYRVGGSEDVGVDFGAPSLTRSGERQTLAGRMTLMRTNRKAVTVRYRLTLSSRPSGKRLQLLRVTGTVTPGAGLQLTRQTVAAGSGLVADWPKQAVTERQFTVRLDDSLKYQVGPLRKSQFTGARVTATGTLTAGKVPVTVTWDLVPPVQSR